MTDHLKSIARELATTHGWRLVVLFGSSVRGEGRDVDIAVLPGATPDLFTLGAWQAALARALSPKPVDLLVLDAALSPTARFRVMRDGVPLFEHAPGLFDRELDRAFSLYADAEKFRRLRHEDIHARST